MTDKIILRDYQEECVNTIIDYAKTKKVLKQVIVLATGLGKTIVFGHLPSKVKAKGKKTLILAHREELLTQAKDRLLMIDPSLRIGIEQGDNIIANDLHLDVLIASVQTLGRKGSARIKKFNPEDYGLIIIDECHHATATTYKNILEHFDLIKGAQKTAHARILLGVTATPNRSDHVGLDEVFDELVYSYTLKQGIDNGYLSNIKAYTVTTATDISKVKTHMGDFAEKELAETINNDERNELIVSTYIEKFKDSKALLFASSVAHTEDITEMFKSAGVKAEYILGSTKKEDRSRILAEFKTGKIKVLCNCAVLTEGFDEPSIATILMARPTKSSVAYSQMVGRGTRLDEGKDGLNLVDFVDNVGKNSIITLPSLFGIPKTLKGTKGKFITEIIDKIDKIQEVNPNYDVSSISSWDDKEIEKVIKRVNIFAQAELDPQVQKHSELSWEADTPDSYKLQIPAQNNVRETVSMKQNMLGKWEIKLQKFVGDKPSYKNGYSNWTSLGNKVLGTGESLEKAFGEADNYIKQNYSSYLAMFKQDSGWRTDSPTDAQVKMLNKFKVAIPPTLTKGQASTLISKAINIRQKLKKERQESILVLDLGTRRKRRKR